MITGFNTDVEHDGVVYHVQTEDKGLETPIILSLVYTGGAILASKRAPYTDLLASGFTEALLAERLKRQHRLICAAIHSGRIADLKRMGAQTPVSSSSAPDEIEFTPAAQEYEPVANQTGQTQASVPEPEPELATLISTVEAPPEPYTIHDPRRHSPLGELPAVDQGLVVSLLDERDFRSGDILTVRVRVSQRSGEIDTPLSNVVVSLKVLGTTFRPQIYSTKTQHNGVASVVTQIPEFTSGRAAILVRAVANGQSTEIRRVVHPGK